MKAVIMAGGRGTRITSIASDIPKPMIRIGGRPVLEWEIEALRSQGFTNIIITVSHLSSVIMDYFGDGSGFGISISYYIEKAPFGNAGAVFKLWQKGLLDEGNCHDFFLLIADAVFDIDFKRFAQFHEQHHALATLFTHPNSHPYDSGLVIADDESHIVTGWLTKEDERPEFYRNRVNAGLHILNTEILKLSGIDPDIVGTECCVDLERDILKPFVSSKRIAAYDSTEYVKDMGTPGRFADVSADLVSGRVAARNLRYPQRAVFLTVEYLYSQQSSDLCKDAVKAVRRINDSGCLCIVYADHLAIANGNTAQKGWKMIQNKIETLLGREGTCIDAFYCCECEEQKLGLALCAADDYNISLKDSWIIGDEEKDLKVFKDAGCRNVSVFDLSEGESCKCKSSTKNTDRGIYAEYIASDLYSAVSYIFKDGRGVCM